FKLRGLDGAEQLGGLVRSGGPRDPLAGVDEGERIPLAARQELRLERALILGVKQGGRAPGQFGEARVCPDSSEPILSVSVVWLPPMHDAVKVAAIGSIDGLSDRMGGV